MYTLSIYIRGILLNSPSVNQYSSLIMKIFIFLPNFSNSSAVIYLKNDNWNFGNRKICFHTSACGIWNCAPLLYSSEWRSLLCHFIKMEVAIFDLVSSQFHLNLMHNRMGDSANFWKDSSNRPIYFSKLFCTC